MCSSQNSNQQYSLSYFFLQQHRWFYVKFSLKPFKLFKDFSNLNIPWKLNFDIKPALLTARLIIQFVWQCHQLPEKYRSEFSYLFNFCSLAISVTYYLEYLAKWIWSHPHSCILCTQHSHTTSNTILLNENSPWSI